ncbi:MAG: glutathione S-transferase family protein [Steroidobacteraceae bacterium]|jgi:glutathione S-transferase
MKLYWCPKTRSLRALWLLEEAGVPYVRVLIDIRSDLAKSDAAFRRASPMGKVPALEDGAVRMWDSGAICTYVADQYPAQGLAPPIGSPLRGAYLQWVMYTNAIIEPAMAEKFAKLPTNSTAYGWGSFALMLSTLRQALEPGPWILGERFSAADILLCMSCSFMRQFGLLEGEPVLAAYADRGLARPAYQRAMAIESQ